MPKINPNCVTIDYKYLIVKYVPIGVNRGRISVAVNIDMKLNYVPLAIMEIVCKKFCRDFMGVVMEASAKFKGSKWEAKMKKQPDTFQFFKEVMVKYFNDKCYGYM